MKRLYFCITVLLVFLSFRFTPASASSLNDNAVLALDTDLSAAGFQSDAAPNGIGPDELVGFAVYVRDFQQLRSFSIDLSWTGDAAIVTGQTGGLTSGTSIPEGDCTVNGASITAEAEPSLFSSELTIGETTGPGAYRNNFAFGGLTSPASDQYRLLYVAVFRTSSAFGMGDTFEVTANVTLCDDDAAGYSPSPLVFRVNGITPSLTLLEPGYGSEFAPGDTCSITWNCTLVDTVDLDYLDENGSWQNIAAGIVSNQHAYTWTIPEDYTGDTRFRLTDAENPAVSAVSGIIAVAPAAHYDLDVFNTGSSATILFHAENPPSINGVPVEAGDEIAVFTSRGNCAGLGIWTGSNCAITIWGDDSTETGTAGFLSGESYLFRVWDASESREYDLDVSYAMGSDVYEPDMVSVVNEASSSSSGSLSIQLGSGWNMISSNVMPDDASMDAVFSDISGSVALVKNGDGEVYWPEYGVNQIGDWRITDGYQVRMSAGGVLQIDGAAVNPDNVNFSLANGWNLISFLGEENDSPANAFAAIMDNLAMAKNGAGETYWPKRDVDQIVAMHHGTGYMVKLSGSVYGQVYRPAIESTVTYFMPVHRSDNNATIMIPADIVPMVNSRMLTSGDEIGVFTPTGVCAGAGLWTGGNLAVTVWGDDSGTVEEDGIRTGVRYEFRIWDSETLSECLADAAYLIGDAQYEDDAIVVLKSLQGTGEPTGVDAEVPIRFELGQNRPNPFNPATTIGFTIPDAAHVTLAVYNALGEKVAVLVDDMLAPGSHEAVWDGGQFASGVYFYRLDAGGVTGTGKMTLVK